MKRLPFLLAPFFLLAACFADDQVRPDEKPPVVGDKLGQVESRGPIKELSDYLKGLERERDRLIAERDAAISERRKLQKRVDELEAVQAAQEKLKRAYSRIWRATSHLREKAANERIEPKDFQEVDRAFAMMMADLADAEEKYRKRVLLVNRERTIVWIHLGKDDGMTVGSKLAVYKGDIAPEKKKGILEVTEVLQGNLSEAKILERTGSFGIGLSDPLELISKPGKAGDDQPDPKGNQTKNSAAN